MKNPTYHGLMDADSATNLVANDGDTVVVFRPEYQRHEVWIMAGDPSVSGWSYLGQGNTAECIKCAKDAVE